MEVERDQSNPFIPGFLGNPREKGKELCPSARTCLLKHPPSASVLYSEKTKFFFTHPACRDLLWQTLKVGGSWVPDLGDWEKTLIDWEEGHGNGVGSPQITAQPTTVLEATGGMYIQGAWKVLSYLWRWSGCAVTVKVSGWLVAGYYKTSFEDFWWSFCLYCWLRRKEEWCANYEFFVFLFFLFFFLFDVSSAVFLVLTKYLLNWISPFLGKQHAMLVYLEMLGSYQEFYKSTSH